MLHIPEGFIRPEQPLRLDLIAWHTACSARKGAPGSCNGQGVADTSNRWHIQLELVHRYFLKPLIRLGGVQGHRRSIVLVALTTI